MRHSFDTEPRLMALTEADIAAQRASADMDAGEPCRTHDARSGSLVAPGPPRQLLADGRDREAAAMSTWALVLAAGEGSRLRALTTTNGVAVPKQFCSLQGGPSLLQEALHRAEAVAPR